MTADFRALCAELLDALENAIGVIHGEDGTKHISTADTVITKADAALAQPAGGLVERVETRAGGDGRAAIREVAAAASQMHASHILRDKNLTWERVAQWLELEASQ